MIIYVGVFMPGSNFSLLAQCLCNLSAVGVTHDNSPTYVRTYGIRQITYCLRRLAFNYK